MAPTSPFLIQPTDPNVVVTSFNSFASSGAPANVVYPLGSFNFTATTPAGGALVTFNIFYDCAQSVNMVFDSTNTDFAPTLDGTGYMFLGPFGSDPAHECVVAIIIQDGGRGDIDGTDGTVTGFFSLALDIGGSGSGSA